MNNKKFIEKLLLDFLNKSNLIKKLIKKSTLENSIKELAAGKSIKKLIKKSINYLLIEEIIKFIK